MEEPTEQPEYMEYRARAFAGNDHDRTMCEGVIVGYSIKPMYCIRKDDGTQEWWREDLVEVTGDRRLERDEYPPRTDPLRREPHFLILPDLAVAGLPMHEAVCFCGALFRSANPMYGTIGEMFSAHIRRARAGERKEMDNG